MANLNKDFGQVYVRRALSDGDVILNIDIGTGTPDLARLREAAKRFAQSVNGESGQCNPEGFAEDEIAKIIGSALEGGRKFLAEAIRKVVEGELESRGRAKYGVSARIQEVLSSTEIEQTADGGYQRTGSIRSLDDGKS